ncbi:MAG: diaminopimelate decarboxylase, partial [Fervidobacterium nodosum]
VLMRPVMYNAYHEINVLDPESSEKYTVDVVGPLCESGDIIAYERNLEIPKVGSYIIVRDVGAYGYSMSNNYNSMPRPAEVIVYEKNGKFNFRLIRRREEIEEMFKTIV